MRVHTLIWVLSTLMCCTPPPKPLGETVPRASRPVLSDILALCQESCTSVDTIYLYEEQVLYFTPEAHTKFCECLQNKGHTVVLTKRKQQPTINFFLPRPKATFIDFGFGTRFAEDSIGKPTDTLLETYSRCNDESHGATYRVRNRAGSLYVVEKLRSCLFE